MICFTGFASLAHAQQPTTTKISFKGNTAHAAAASGDNGCFSAFFGVTASDEVSKGDNGTTTTKPKQSRLGTVVAIFASTSALEAAKTSR